VLLEGFALGRRSDGYDRILERLDLLVFLEVDEATAKRRRFAREAELRARGGGFSEEQMERFWNEVLEPGMRQWLDDARAAADVVIDPDERGEARSVRTSSDRVLALLGRG
jgi:uridine kinase